MKTTEAAKVMQQMIDLAIKKARDRGILGTKQLGPSFQGLLTEAFAEIPSSFKNREELAFWADKGFKEESEKVRVRFQA